MINGVECADHCQCYICHAVTIVEKHLVDGNKKVNVCRQCYDKNKTIITAFGSEVAKFTDEKAKEQA